MPKQQTVYRPNCSVSGIMASENVSKDTLLSLLKNEWKFVVLGIVAYHRQTHYNSIKEESGLSSKTLSLVLKELTKEGLLERRIVQAWPVRTEYSLTEAGMKVTTVSCPLLEFRRPEGSKEITSQSQP